MHSLPVSNITESDRQSLLIKYRQTRELSEQICQPLAIEDHAVQPCAEVSPPKWHLGHTAWFFEEMLLARFIKDYARINPEYGQIFNSYYKGAGKHWLQSERGQLSRPTVQEILDYRRSVDERVIDYLESDQPATDADRIIELGLHHEQQHQELLYMDIKYILGVNPLLPCYVGQPQADSPAPSQQWRQIDEGIYEVGHSNNSFAYDNEKPEHKTYLYPFSIRQGLVSNAEYLAFMNDGGYQDARYWLSKGYDFINEHQVNAPLYWTQKNGQWYEFSLHGLRPLEPNAPVCHVSYYEASAFANWHGSRLPTEQEFETALLKNAMPNDEKKPLALQPYDANASNQVWCWTASHYSPYPGYKTFDGPLQEYNGKFMCNQFVLRGGCVATPAQHLRHSYRNFYEPHQRWMFSGIRLARDSA